MRIREHTMTSVLVLSVHATKVAHFVNDSRTISCDARQLSHSEPYHAMINFVSSSILRYLFRHLTPTAKSTKASQAHLGEPMLNEALGRPLGSLGGGPLSGGPGDPRFPGRRRQGPGSSTSFDSTDGTGGGSDVSEARVP